MVTETSNREPALAQAVSRVARRPRPWVLRYLLATLPALLIAPLLLIPLRSWFKYPLFVEALQTRSLDHLLEVLEGSMETFSPGPLLPLALLLVPIGWLLVRALWIFLEGGILATYARPLRLTWREFFHACWHWFGALLLLGIMWLVGALVLGAVAVAVGLLVRSLWAPLGTAVFLLGAVAIVLLWLWFSLARSTSVVRNDRNVFHALGSAARVIVRQPTGVLALFVGVLALRVLLSLASRAGLSALPFSWWLLALVLQQLVVVVGTGLTLVRRAGEVALASQVYPQAHVTPPHPLD